MTNLQRVALYCCHRDPSQAAQIHRQHIDHNIRVMGMALDTSFTHSCNVLDASDLLSQMVSVAMFGYVDKPPDIQYVFHLDLSVFHCLTYEVISQVDMLCSCMEFVVLG